MNNKQQALATIIEIAKKYDLSETDVAHAIRNTSVKVTPEQESSVGSSLAYLGAILVFGGLCAFVSMHWESLNAMARILVTFGSGIVLFTVGMMILTYSNAQKISQSLFLMAWVLQVAGFYIMLAEWFPATGQWALPTLIIGSITCLQYLLVSMGFNNSVLLALTMLSLMMAMIGGLDIIDVQDNIQLLIYGGVLFVFSHLFMSTTHKTLTPLTFFFAGTLFLMGLFDSLENTKLDLLFVIPNILILCYSVAYKSKTLLFVSTFSLFLFIGYFTFRHFAHEAGWPIALMISGASFLIIALMILQLKKRFVD